MEKLKRTIFFWTLAILFIITTPIVVMRARGFRFDFSRGVFVHSGSITVKSNPQDIDIVLNGKLTKSKTLSRINNSYSISGLMPREYEVEISADGYKKWNKKITVHSGFSSELWNVVLVRNSYERTQYASPGLGKFFLSSTDKYAVFDRKTESGTEMSILNIKKNAIENTFSLPGWDLADDSRKENIEWSPEDDFLSVPVQRTSDQEETGVSDTDILEYSYIILDPKREDFFDLSEFLGMANMRYVRWDPQEKGFLFFQKDGGLYRANILDKNYLELIATSVSAYELSETNIYYSQSPAQLIYKASLDRRSDHSQLTDSFPQDSPKEISRLIVYDERRIAFLNSAKELFVYNAGDHARHFRKLSDSIEGMQFSNDGKKLLYWGDNEISAYFLRDWNVQPIRNENEIQNITRYSEQLRNVQWFADYEHVIFSVGTQIKIIELDSRDHRNSMDLVTVKSSSPFAVYNHSLENLFFIDKAADSASALYSISFPEKTGLLGL